MTSLNSKNEKSKWTSPHSLHPNIKDLTGHKFGRLTVISYVGSFKRNPKVTCAKWLCHCDCGNQIVALAPTLNGGSTHSCGCLKRDLAKLRFRTHGKSKTPTYRTWCKIVERCCNPKDRRYSDYGGRGITICDKWKNSFEAFLKDMGERPSAKFSIDRYPNNNGNYEPGNCRWATQYQQSRNQRTTRHITHNGKTMCLQDWALEVGIKRETIAMRLRYNWPVEKALTVSPEIYKHRQKQTEMDEMESIINQKDK